LKEESTDLHRTKKKRGLLWGEQDKQQKKTRKTECDKTETSQQEHKKQNLKKGKIASRKNKRQRKQCSLGGIKKK